MTAKFCQRNSVNILFGLLSLKKQARHIWNVARTVAKVLVDGLEFVIHISLQHISAIRNTGMKSFRLLVVGVNWHPRDWMGDKPVKIGEHIREKRPQFVFVDGAVFVLQNQTGMWCWQIQTIFLTVSAKSCNVCLEEATHLVVRIELQSRFLQMFQSQILKWSRRTLDQTRKTSSQLGADWSWNTYEQVVVPYSAREGVTSEKKVLKTSWNSD